LGHESASGTARSLPESPISTESADGLAGPELARAVLDAARSRRTARAPRRRAAATEEEVDLLENAGVDDGAPAVGGQGGVGQGGVGQGGPRRGGGPRRRRTGYSGAGPDPRDPQPFGAILAKLVKARGWQRPAAEATVFGDWKRVVGADVASRSRPVKLEDGELTVEAETTAWATQLRLLAPSLLQRIASVVGHNVVRKLHVHGPAAPSWSRGPRRVRGRGPRDTYG
jgi:predicted nucleic acid-binding Zn ribbon protein